MQRSRLVLIALAPVLLNALAREVDRALGLVLRAELEPAGLLVQVARALAADAAGAGLRVGYWLAAGATVLTVLAGVRAQSSGQPLGDALDRARLAFAPLYLRPALTLLALAAVFVHPSYPYGFTLGVALTQDWAIAQDVLALAVLLALHLPPLRLPPPRAREVFLISFIGYGLLAPEWARVWEGHPGNEPKYLRQAVALGHGLTFDAEGVSAAMEDLPVRPLAAAARSAAATIVRESLEMAAAVGRGEAGRGAIRAERITRQTIRGKNGGVYYVLAPGPALLLAPTLRIDRALNLAQGIRGRLAVTLLAWSAIAALLVAALFELLRHATGPSHHVPADVRGRKCVGASGHAGMAAVLAFGFALTPPFVFYFFQFYPEMPAALLLAALFAALSLRPERLARHPWLFGCALAVLPWLHQKFLPVWGTLTFTALVVACRYRPSGAGVPEPKAGWPVSRLLGIAVPQLASLYLTLLYNFAITGSVRPDALFLAWGPGGVTTARMGQGLLGLLFDARYGILPYVPFFLLAFAGLQRGARRFALALPSALVYYLTVASADNWAGAVCNLGRYLMPLAPLAVALVGMALASARDRRDATASRGLVALALALAGWTVLVSYALWQDPHAANDSALWLAKSTFADGNQYLPNLFLRHWHDAAPGLDVRIAVWILLVLSVGWAARRSPSPMRVLVGTAGLLLTSAFVLEQWPPQRSAPRFTRALPAGGRSLVFFEGEAQVQEDQAIVGPGTLGLVRRTFRDPQQPAAADPAPLRTTIGGTGVLKIRGGPPIALRPSGSVVDLPVLPYHEVVGRDGRVAVFARTSATVSGQAVMRFGWDEGASAVPPARHSSPAPNEDAEPERSGSR